MDAILSDIEYHTKRTAQYLGHILDEYYRYASGKGSIKTRSGFKSVKVRPSHKPSLDGLKRYLEDGMPVYRDGVDTPQIRKPGPIWDEE